MSKKCRTDKIPNALFHDNILDEELMLVDILPTEVYPNRFWLCERATNEGCEYVIRDDCEIYDCYYYGRGN